MKKQEKKAFAEKLSGELKSAKSLVLVNYAGLGVKAQQELKARLSEVGGRMVVVKNTLLKIAGKAAGIDKDILADSILVGQTAVIIAEDDPVAPIQVLGKFAKEFEVPKFKVGIVEGSFQDETSLAKLSALPGRDALLGQLLGTLMGPMYGLTGTLSGNIQKLVYILNVKSQNANLKSESQI